MPFAPIEIAGEEHHFRSFFSWFASPSRTEFRFRSTHTYTHFSRKFPFESLHISLICEFAPLLNEHRPAESFQTLQERPFQGASQGESVCPSSQLPITTIENVMRIIDYRWVCVCKSCETRFGRLTHRFESGSEIAVFVVLWCDNKTISLSLSFERTFADFQSLVSP